MDLSNLIVDVTKYLDDLKHLESEIKDFSGLQLPRLIYNGAIITAYGLFECNIDNIFNDCFDIFSRKNPYAREEENYNRIVKKIFATFQGNLGEFLTNSSRHTNIDQTELPEIIENYNEALKSQYIKYLKKEILMFHSGNLNAQKVFKYLKVLGFENLMHEMVITSPLHDYLLSIYEFDSVIKKKLSSNECDLFSKIDALVLQRNEIAHKGYSENRISKDALLETINFLQIFAKSLLIVLLKSILQMIKVRYRFKKSQTTYHSGTDIVGCVDCKYSIGVGDYLILKSSSRVDIFRIMSIQLNKKDVISTGGNCGNVTFRCNGKVLNSHIVLDYLSF